MYWWAAHSRYLAQISGSEFIPSWLKIELCELKENDPSDILYKWDEKLIKKIRNPMITHTVCLWVRLQQTLGQKGTLSPKTPLWNNRLLPKCFQDKHFKKWADKGISRLEQCFEDGILMSFEQLKIKYNLDNKEFFRYLQLWDFLRVKTQLKLPSLTQLEQFVYSSVIQNF